MGIISSTDEDALESSNDNKSDLEPTSRLKPNRTTDRLKELYKEGVSLDDFQVLDHHIGEGGFAKVMKVRHTKSKEIYACKVLKKKQLLKDKQVVNIFTERGILIRLRHPFVVSMQYAFQTKDRLFFVLDYCAGGDFFRWLQKNRKFSERLTRFYAAEICLSLEALHTNDIIHRDIKPENILLTSDGHLKLTDFGLSKWGGNRSPSILKGKTFLGSAPYLAPEILESESYTKAVDWWAFGVLITEMLMGLPAFYDQNDEQNYKRIQFESIGFKKYLSRESRSIILDLLEKNPKFRMKDSKDVKKHDFFYLTDWDGILNKTVKVPLVLPDRSKTIQEDGNLSDMFKVEMKEEPVNEIDASREIDGDMFLGFTYVAGPSMLAESSGTFPTINE